MQAEIEKVPKAVNQRSTIGKLELAKAPKQSTKEAKKQAEISESAKAVNISSLSYR